MIQELIDSIVDGVSWAVVQVVSLLLQGLLAVFQAIPAPSWLSSAPNLSGVSEWFSWFAGIVELEFGASVVGAALVLRFLIRRLPVVG